MLQRTQSALRPLSDFYRNGHLREFWRLGPLLREGAEIAARSYAAKIESASASASAPKE
jgi:hypothetical protein